MANTWSALWALNGSAEDFLLITLLCSLRMFAAFSIFPATSQQAIEGTARAGIVMLIGSFIAFGQPADLTSHLGGANLFILLTKEAFLGLLLGYVGSTVFWVAESAGALIDNVAGYNNVQQTNPLSTQQTTPVSGTLLQLCVTLFYTFGGFLFLISTLFETYLLWPIASLTPEPVAILERFIILQTDTLMTQTVKIASPVLMIMVLIDLSFGLVAKTAGKLEPNSLAQPVKSTVALLVVLLSLNVFVQQLTVSLSLADLKVQLQNWAAARAP
jgi:type III secretion protein T